MIFFNIKIITYWIDMGQLELTCQISNSDYETIVTLKKANHNKL